jgi:uncharacterized protein
MNVLLLCCAALVLLYTVLGVNVLRMQRRKRLAPETTDFELQRAVQAQANEANYVPLLVASLLYLSYFPHGLLAPMGILATLSRVAHAVGMLTARRPDDRNLLCMLGTAGTYACLIGIAIVFLRLGVKVAA